jgi:radical SAM superfamily enzyme
MKDAGCFGVKLGFESGSQYVVDKIVNKHLDLGYARTVVDELKRIGMTVHGTFTVGLPGETREQMAETLAFIESLPLDSHQLSGTAEIEGTPLHTLRTAGHLDAYEGASMEAGSTMHTDGNKRFAQLAEELRNS